MNTVDYKGKYDRFLNKNKKFVNPTADQIIRWLDINDIKYKDKGGEQIRCCNPDGDENFSMQIHKSNAVVHDFRVSHAQYDGPFLKFVSNYKGISYREAIEEVCGNNVKTGFKQTQHDDDDDDVVNEIELPKGCMSIRDKFDSKLWNLNFSYLVNERGLDKETVFKANIHYLGTTIYVPFYQYGMIVYYQSRMQMSKIFNFPDSSLTSKKASDFLYGFDNVEPCSKAVYIFESIYNCLSYGDDAVATGGAGLKDGQVNLIKVINPDSVVLCPDNDGAGIKSISNDYLALSKIRDFGFSKNIYYCLPPKSKEPNKQEDWNDMKQNNVDIKDYIKLKKAKLSMMDIVEGVNTNFTL